MNRKFNPVLVLGALLLVVGVVVLSVLAAGGDGDAKSVKALVATQDIAQGATASATVLKIQDVKSSDAPIGTVSNLQQLTGQIALAPIAKGTVITSSAFGQYGATTPAGVSLPKGKEALGIELGFAPGGLRYVVPGNKVTVWVAVKQKQSSDGTVKFVQGVPLVSDVLVLRTTPGVGNGAGTAAVAGPGNLDFLLAVDKAQAAKIIGAASQTDVQVLYVTLSSTSTS